ncbi:MAG: hypothetical protein IJ960_09295 [Oscillospiraceae bacterium]|nr:hypothetical protein [Oscillospiraceae bacterium]
MDSVILQSALAMFLYGAALFLNLFDRHYRASGGWMTVAAAVIAVGATAYALVIGAGLWECATVLLIFLLLNMEVRE